jgi:peptidoglycan/xylan/chitin deacetylase (PgdA/CDA1 family)
MSPVASFVRNLSCGVLAAILIATGRVRRAKKRALSRPVVTALYFHKPEAKLFLSCVRWLSRHGYTFISATELSAFLYLRASLPPGAVWLSFDDGCSELLKNVLPVVRRYNIPVTLFIPSGIVEGDGQFPWLMEPSSGRHAITVEELQMIARYPEVTIGSHTVSHADLRYCSEKELDRELRESRRMLEAWTGRTVDCLSYPYGFFDERTMQAAHAAGYTLAVTTENASITPNANLYLVPRFSVANAITFPEMVCNAVGVWGPTINPLKELVRMIGSTSRTGRPTANRVQRPAV